MGLSCESQENERRVPGCATPVGICGARLQSFSCRAAVMEEKPEILPVQKETHAEDVI